MLAVWRDDFEVSGMPEALRRPTFVLSENFKTNEFGIIGTNKCGNVKLLYRVIELWPGVFQWHTSRAVTELMGLNVETSKPAPTPGRKYCLRKQDSAGGQLRNVADGLEDEDCSVAGTLSYHALDSPDIHFSTGRCMKGLRAFR